ncbi:hypothetical protein XH80_25635 [Bradyrhizobium sp. CCBAU 45384]|nr:hypothetical protein [Bradyrhizobium sp. CCBAU 45384]
MKHIAKGTSVKVIADVSDDARALLRTGFSEDSPDGTTLLPPIRGPVSRFNAEGKWQPDKTKPKESRYIRTVRWKWKQWSGRGQTEEREDFKDIHQECYPRIVTPPPSVEISLRRLESRILIVSPTINVDEAEDLKHIINLFLELIGHCEVAATDLKSLSPPHVQQINWKLLPPGEYPWSRMRTHLTFALRKASESVAAVIQDRQDTLVSLGPTTIYIGVNGFSDYIAYEFEPKGIVVLESIRRDNAIYVFGSDWEAASRLSKKQILDASLQKTRIVHSTGWKEKLRTFVA